MTGLELKGIYKRFGASLILREVNALFTSGEVTAMLGANGVGKSTLAKIVAGVLRADRGEMRLFGKRYAPRNVRSALDAGVVAIYQEFSPIPDWAVWEHFASYGFTFFASKISGIKVAASSFGSLGVDIDPNRLVHSLNALELQTAEIAKAIAARARVFVVDEPTSGLDTATRLSVYKLLRRIASSDCVVIVISHDINAVLEFSDRVLVLRNGFATAPRNARDLNARNLFDLEPIQEKRPLPQSGGATDKSLTISALDKSGAVISKACNIAPGNVVGIAAHPASNGHDFLRSMCGLSALVQTEVFLSKMPFPSQPHERLRAGMAYVSRERSAEWLFEELSVAENLNMASMFVMSNGLIRNFSAELRNAKSLVERFGILAPSLTSVVTVLSGGNRQKVVVWRAISA